MFNNSNEPRWLPYKEVDFFDESIMQYSIDTRDFCCVALKEKSEKKLDFCKINKQPKMFYHTADEMVELLDRYFEESGGDKKWRMFTLSGEGKKYSYGWQMKYIRIFRTELGLIIANSDGYFLNKTILSSDVEQQYLHAH